MRFSILLLAVLPLVSLAPFATTEAQQMVRLPFVDSLSFSSDTGFRRSVNEFLEHTNRDESWAYDSQHRATLTYQEDTIPFRVIVLRRTEDPWVSDTRVVIESYCFAHLNGSAAWCVLGAAHGARQAFGTKTVHQLIKERSGSAVTHCTLALAVNPRGEIDPQWIVTVDNSKRLFINADSGEIHEVPQL